MERENYSLYKDVVNNPIKYVLLGYDPTKLIDSSDPKIMDAMTLDFVKTVFNKKKDCSEFYKLITPNVNEKDKGGIWDFFLDDRKIYDTNPIADLPESVVSKVANKYNFECEGPFDIWHKAYSKNFNELLKKNCLSKALDVTLENRKYLLLNYNKNKETSNKYSKYNCTVFDFRRYNFWDRTTFITSCIKEYFNIFKQSNRSYFDCVKKYKESLLVGSGNEKPQEIFRRHIEESKAMRISYKELCKDFSRKWDPTTVFKYPQVKPSRLCDDLIEKASDNFFYYNKSLNDINCIPRTSVRNKL